MVAETLQAKLSAPNPIWNIATSNSHACGAADIIFKMYGEDEDDEAITTLPVYMPVDELFLSDDVLFRSLNSLAPVYFSTGFFTICLIHGALLLVYHINYGGDLSSTVVALIHPIRNSPTTITSDNLLPYQLNPVQRNRSGGDKLSNEASMVLYESTVKIICSTIVTSATRRRFFRSF